MQVVVLKDNIQVDKGTWMFEVTWLRPDHFVVIATGSPQWCVDAKGISITLCSLHPNLSPFSAGGFKEQFREPDLCPVLECEASYSEPLILAVEGLVYPVADRVGFRSAFRREGTDTQCMLASAGEEAEEVTLGSPEKWVCGVPGCEAVFGNPLEKRAHFKYAH